MGEEDLRGVREGLGLRLGGVLSGGGLVGFGVEVGVVVEGAVEGEGVVALDCGEDPGDPEVDVAVLVNGWVVAEFFDDLESALHVEPSVGFVAESGLRGLSVLDLELLHN